jgi:hypothetical protein
MADPGRLETRLGDLARDFAWPPTPDLLPGVRDRLAQARRRRRLVLLAAATLVAVLAGGTAAAAYIGLRGAALQRVPHLPPSAPVPSGSVGVRLSLGDRYATLADAEAAAGFRALVPASLGTPDQVWYRGTPGVLTLLYRPRPDLRATSDPEVGALVMEARASVDEQSFGKLAGPGTQVQPLEVNGGSGFWISGAPHAFFLLQGPSREADRFRLAGDVLIWNQAGRVVRIESSLSRERALALAGTVR